MIEKYVCSVCGNKTFFIDEYFYDEPGFEFICAKCGERKVQ